MLSRNSRIARVLVFLLLIFVATFLFFANQKSPQTPMIPVAQKYVPLTEEEHFEGNYSYSIPGVVVFTDTLRSENHTLVPPSTTVDRQEVSFNPFEELPNLCMSLSGVKGHIIEEDTVTLDPRSNDIVGEKLTFPLGSALGDELYITTPGDSDLVYLKTSNHFIQLRVNDGNHGWEYYLPVYTGLSVLVHVPDSDQDSYATFTLIDPRCGGYAIYRANMVTGNILFQGYYPGG